MLKNKLKFFIKALNAGGWKTVLKYFLHPTSKPLSIKLFNTEIIIRKNSPDLHVAVASLGGEYNLTDDLLPKDYSGYIIDAGGYIGSAAISFAKKFPNAQIITIEPSSENLSILHKNIENYSTITAIQGALCAHKNEIIPLVNRNTGQWGYSIAKSVTDKTNSQEIESVHGYTLHDLGIDISQVGLLKLDIEGSEKEILETCHEILDKIPAILVELHERIEPGCEEAFQKFSRNRWTIKSSKEKYLSLSRNLDIIKQLK